MLVNLKAMIVVLSVAAAMFVLVKPLCLRFMPVDDFTRRRNVWLALTVTAFASPSFWLFVLVAFVVTAWAARRDSNPVALYVLVLYVIPPVRTAIPVEVVTQIFDVNNYRVLAFALLLPTALRLIQSPGKATGRITWMDGLLLLFCVLQLVLYVPYESFTNTLRRAFLLFIDVLLLYFVVSRTCTTRQSIVDTMATLCLACAIFAPLALFEMLKGWLLYEGLGFEWGNAIPFSYITRGDSLRASVSAGHAIPLGFLLAIAFGFWLYLSSQLRSLTLTVIGCALMWAALLATYSRAPWISGAAILFAYLALGPNGFSRLAKASLLSAIAAGLVVISPLGERVIDSLPFIGTMDADTVAYRQELAAVSWQLILRNPLFGDPFYIDQMEELRQGQGIIDLMNGYAHVALAYGVVGLALMVGFFLVGMVSAFHASRVLVRSNADLSLLGASLVACMFGTALMLAMGGFAGSVEKMFYVLAGLAACYAQLAGSRVSAAVDRPGRHDRKRDPSGKETAASRSRA